jgi:uncharacterized protein
MKAKKEIRDKENVERLESTIATLESFKENKDLPRVIRNQIKDIYEILKEEKNGSISVRAANAVSMLDSLTQNRHMESHIKLVKFLDFNNIKKELKKNNLRLIFVAGVSLVVIGIIFIIIIYQLLLR